MRVKLFEECCGFFAIFSEAIERKDARYSLSPPAATVREHGGSEGERVVRMADEKSPDLQAELRRADLIPNSEAEFSTSGAPEGSPRREPWEKHRNNKPRQGRQN